MAWLRFDDLFTIHRKVEGLSDAAFRLHVCAIFWCARNETDGFVGADDLANAAPRGMTDPASVVPELTRYGKLLWVETDGGWVIHDYLEYQFSKAQLAEARKKNAARQQRFRSRTRGNRNAVSNALVTRGSNAVSNAAPTRPDPTQKRDEPSSSLSTKSDSDFAAFYDAYPKHVGRLAAEAAWAKAKKRADPAAIIAGAKRYAEERRGQDKRFTKHPATWLNQGCWEDEPTTPGHQGFQNPDPNDYYGEL
jgi:hypothetical protein